MATTPEFNEAQLEAARKAGWHQDGAKLVTLEDAREWIDRYGLVAFAPAKLALTAPTLAEATLGAASTEISLNDMRVARNLAARLTAEGAALPLNLLGGGGDMPDFLVSGAAFKYIFTLRGDKTWKQAPATTGANKVTTLALRVFETLTEKGAMTASELASELGREVTEAAIVRALSELWQMLRVIPNLHVGDGETMWELTNKRFTKAIKAGVNAGQPTALSALVSLYLEQALVASEDEIESFLSPVAARSRVRDVVHALRAARELSEVVVAGKTLLHIEGAVLAMPEVAAPEPTEEEIAAKAAQPPVRFSETETPEPGRIKKFEAGKTSTGSFGRGPREERARRPFTRREDAAPRTDFTKPWDEKPSYGDRKPRRDFAASGEGEDRPRRSFSADRERKPFGDRPRKPFTRREDEQGSGERPFRPRKPFAPREGGEDRPRRSFGGDGDRKPFASRGPRKPFAGGEGSDRPRRPFVKREDGKAGDRPFRPRKPFAPREGGEGRPPRKDFGDRPRRPFVKREEGEGAERPFRPRKPFAPREGGDGRPPRKDFGDRPRRPFTPREGGEGRPPRKDFGDRPRRPFVKREEGEGGERPFRPRKPFGAGAAGDRPKRPYVKREGSEDRPKRPYVKREGGEDRPKRPYVRREGGEGEGRPPRKNFGGGFKKPGGFGGGRSGGGGAFKRAGKPGGSAGKPRGAKPGAPRKPRPRAEE